MVASINSRDAWLTPPARGFTRVSNNHPSRSRFVAGAASRGQVLFPNIDEAGFFDRGKHVVQRLKGRHAPAELRGRVVRFLLFGQRRAAQQPLQRLPASARLEYPVRAAEIGELVFGIAKGFVIQHRIEAGVGKRKVHEIPATELDQMADPPLLRMLRRHRDMGFADRQPGHADATGLGQRDRGAADAAAGIQHMPVRTEVANPRPASDWRATGFPGRSSYPAPKDRNGRPADPQRTSPCARSGRHSAPQPWFPCPFRQPG